MSHKKVRILGRVGDPKGGVILQPGAIADLPEVWADRYVSQGKAEYVDSKVKTEKADDEKPKGKKK